jgi:hypothetical protein
MAMVLPKLKDLVDSAARVASNDWLIHTELLEIAEDVKLQAEKNLDHTALIQELSGRLHTIARVDGSAAQHIADARKTFHATP